MTKKIIAGLVVLIFATSVYFLREKQNETEPPPPPPSEVEIKNPAAIPEIKKTPAEIATLVEANNRFAFELFTKYSDSKKNIFFSPFSISSALGMTLEGARNETAAEIRDVFHFPENDESRRAAFKNIFVEINRGEKNYELATANALWAQKNYKFLDEYFATVKNFYDGEIRNLDFVGELEKSRLAINSWVEAKTKDKIKNLIRKLDPMTKLVLTNAIYFKGDWAEKFAKKNTTNREFELISGEKIETPTMFLADEFNFGETENWQILELPYRDDELSMLVFLPTKNISPNLDLKNFDKLMGNLRRQKVKIYFPKFKLETRYEMARDLAELGMPTAFSRNADFSGMNGNRDFFISQIVHQAFVEVDEEGTEAAAATAVMMTIESSLAEPTPTPIFRADHPFIFAIRENTNGEILFLGRMTDPRG